MTTPTSSRPSRSLSGSQQAQHDLSVAFRAKVADLKEAAGGRTVAEQQAQRGVGTHGQGRNRRLWELEPSAGGMGLLLWLGGIHWPGQQLILQEVPYVVVARHPGHRSDHKGRNEYLRAGRVGAAGTGA